MQYPKSPWSSAHAPRLWPPAVLDDQNARIAPKAAPPISLHDPTITLVHSGLADVLADFRRGIFIHRAVRPRRFAALEFHI